MNVRDIPIEKIHLGKNIRSEPDGEIGELMESMERYDLLQPVIVVKKDGGYELVAGFRRVKAAQMRNEQTIAANVLDNLKDSQIALVRLTENVLRKEISTRELLECVDVMKVDNPGLSDHAIAKMLGKQASWLYEKRKAYEGYQKLLADGFPEATVNELKDSELKTLTKQKQPARAPRKKGKAFISGKDISHDFELFIDGKRKLIIICGSSRIRTNIMALLYRERDNVYRGLEPKHAD